MPVRVVVVLKTAPGVLGISKRVKRAVKQIPLWLYTSLPVGVLRGEKVFKGGVVQKQSYKDISNIRIINIQILYLFGRYSS